MNWLNKIVRRFGKLTRKSVFSRHNLYLFSGLFILFLAFIMVWVATLKVPDYNSFVDRKIINSTKIYDKTGEVLLFDIHQNERRTNIPFEDMGMNIKNATIAIEDSEFYNHSGVRVKSTIRAVFSNIFHIGIGGGGSTITQQLVKNTLLTPKKTLVRKFKEWVLAFKLDASMDKDKILELYLNEVPYGGTIYGVEEASRAYFNKHAYDLSIAEAAYLASIPQSPSYLSPYGKHLDKLEERKNLVLSRMKSLNFITEEQYSEAKNTVVTFTPQDLKGIKAPHFVFFIKEYLEEKYGADMVENGGLKVTTTLDYKLQEKAEIAVKEGALQNEKDWGGSNAALVSIDPKTGQILAMVGSRDYSDKLIDGNFNVTTALRQPGSSFKPFIYATAFNKGFTPETVLFDLPTEFQTTCNAYGKALPGHKQSDCYMPDNYDGKFRGPMSLRNALAQSINIPAIKLFYLAGLRDSLKTAEDLGISTLTDVNRYGLTLVIGGGEVSLLEMTSAYGVFANSGVKNNHTGILKVEDSKGNVLEEFEQKSTEVLPKNTALTVSDILSDNESRIPTFGANSPLLIPGYEVAVKTGTTNSNKDAWTIGYTPSIVTGVWAGNNDNKPMKKGGSALAGPIWNRFMKEALVLIPNESFEKPVINSSSELKPVLRGSWLGNETFFINKFSGKLATKDTPPELIKEVAVTNVHTILYWVDKNNILGEAPKNPSSDPQFSNWEIPVQNWWAQNKYKYNSTSYLDRPTEYDSAQNTNSNNINILEPNQEKVYKEDDLIYLKIENKYGLPIKKIDIFINGIYLGSTASPFSFPFVPSELDVLKNENELKIISYDSNQNRSETTSYFFVE